MKQVLGSPLLKIFLAGLLLRLLIMPFYFHPDMKTYDFQASFLSQGVWNIYDYLIDHRADLPLKEEFVYFPLTYFSLGAYQWLISPLAPGLTSWLSDASQSAVTQVGAFRYLFLLKLPYLLVDLAIGAMLVKWGATLADKRRILNLWLFNPFTLVLIYVFSNIDILIVGLTVWSALLIRRGHWWWGALMLGLGAGFKAYPLLLLPFVVLAAPRFKDRLMTALIGLGSFLLIIAPFLLSPGFRQATLVSGLTTRLFFPSIGIGFQEFLMPGVVALAGLVFVALSQRVSVNQLVGWWAALLLLVFGTIHYHISWLLWLAPWMVLLVAFKRRLSWLVVGWGLLAMMVPVIYNDKFMNAATLGVIDPLFLSLPTLFTAVQRLIDPYVLIGVVHSAMLGAGLVLVWQWRRFDVED